MMENNSTEGFHANSTDFEKLIQGDGVDVDVAKYLIDVKKQALMTDKQNCKRVLRPANNPNFVSSKKFKRPISDSWNHVFRSVDSSYSNIENKTSMENGPKKGAAPAKKFTTSIVSSIDMESEWMKSFMNYLNDMNKELMKRQQRRLTAGSIDRVKHGKYPPSIIARTSSSLINNPSQVKQYQFSRFEDISDALMDFVSKDIPGHEILTNICFYSIQAEKIEFLDSLISVVEERLAKISHKLRDMSIDYDKNEVSYWVGFTRNHATLAFTILISIDKSLLNSEQYFIIRKYFRILAKISNLCKYSLKFETLGDLIFCNKTDDRERVELWILVLSTIIRYYFGQRDLSI